MLDAANEAIGFMNGKTRDQLTENRMLQYAVVRAIEIFGEAAYKVSDTGRGAHPELPWGKIIGMRHRLTHDYSEIDLDIVWSTVRDDLPQMVQILVGIVPPLERP
jgi:uncharacterized protein with HEPN domain